MKTRPGRIFADSIVNSFHKTQLNFSRGPFRWFSPKNRNTNPPFAWSMNMSGIQNFSAALGFSVT